MTDTVIWLGEKRAAALRDLVAAQFRIIDKPPSGAQRCGVIAESDEAEAGLRLALARPETVSALVLLAPRLIDAAGRTTDDALMAQLGALKVPVLALFGTKDRAAPPEAGRHYRAKLPNCNIVFVYDAGVAMAEERPAAVAEVMLDFLKRGETFLVRQASDLLYL